MKKDLNSNRPDITTSVIRDKDDKIFKVITKRYIKKLGDSGYSVFPRELIGKYVKIELDVIK